MACLVLVALHKEGAVGRRLGASNVTAEVGLGVCLGAGQECGLGGGHVLELAPPRLKGGLLQGTAIGEGHGPRALALDLVHGVEVDGGLLLRQTAGQEGDAGHGGGHAALQGADSVLGDLLGGHGLGALCTGHGHGGLEDGALEEDAVIAEGLVHGSQHLLLHLGGALDAVVAVHQDLRLHDGHQAGLLHGTSVAGKTPCILLQRKGGGGVVGDLQHGSPLGEAGALCVIVGGALLQAVQASAPCLEGLSTGQGLQASVDLDAGEDVVALQDVNERLSVLALVQGLLVQDGAGDVLAEAGGGEK
mmetsp:Transcript_15975/g.35376  ORF Transcript_15975/g.35376 Transcript_15975/m.35376 type:complete len:304 (-) Transcript_15975:303-1214(-)